MYPEPCVVLHPKPCVALYPEPCVALHPEPCVALHPEPCVALPRYGLGRFTTEAEVDRAASMTVSHVNRLREMSPLWEMVQEGVNIKDIQWAQH